jgi:hypothetical protein
MSQKTTGHELLVCLNTIHMVGESIRPRFFSAAGLLAGVLRVSDFAVAAKRGERSGIQHMHKLF